MKVLPVITPSARRLLKRRIGSIPRFVGRHLQWISFRKRQMEVIPNPHPTRCSSPECPCEGSGQPGSHCEASVYRELYQIIQGKVGSKKKHFCALPNAPLSTTDAWGHLRGRTLEIGDIPPPPCTVPASETHRRCMWLINRGDV